MYLLMQYPSLFYVISTNYLILCSMSPGVGNTLRCNKQIIRQFFLTQLRTTENELAYYVGIQVGVDKRGPGQMPSNPGWIYTLGNHV
jgi:hypothetical protein